MDSMGPESVGRTAVYRKRPACEEKGRPTERSRNPEGAPDAITDKVSETTHHQAWR